MKTYVDGGYLHTFKIFCHTDLVSLWSIVTHSGPVEIS
jgi:hypothetical protein